MRRLLLLSQCLVLACSAAERGADGASASSSQKPSATPSLPALTEEELGELRAAVEAIQHAPADQRPVIAAYGLAEVEQRRAPVVAAALESLTTAAPEHRSALVSRSLTDAALRPALEATCPDAMTLMKALSELAPDKRGPAIESGCKLTLGDKASRAADPLATLFAHAVLTHLGGAQAHPDETALLEMMTAGGAPASGP